MNYEKEIEVLSITEENYLKSLFYLSVSHSDKEGVGTNELATSLEVKPSSANDMLKKLKMKGFIEYEKYGKIFLTKLGKSIGVQVIRKHRLWETFLFEKLEFTWDEVHEVAEQLEHIHSEKLISKLDKFLGFPKVDPHGDPIPDENGVFAFMPKKMLCDIPIGQTCKMISVKDNSPSFLNFVAQLGLGVDKNILVISKQEFDSSIEISIENKVNRVSLKFAQNIFVE
jgi:DtxR family Mn-dependent transcriptional regulator